MPAVKIVRLFYVPGLVLLGAMSVSAQDSPSVPYNNGQPAPGIAVIDDNARFDEQLDVAIEATSRRYLTANVHTPWQIFHGILAKGKDFELKLGEDRVAAIDWISTSNPYHAGRPWILKTQHGATFHPYVRGLEMVFQGHPAQGLALITPCNLPPEHEFKLGNGSVTIADMIQHVMMEVNSQEETTWVLWSLNHYLKTDASWVNKFNQRWSIESLVRNEVTSRVEGAACGGNHRLFALTKARDKLLATGQPLRGAWFEADQRVNRYLQTAQMLQNSDGSFSSSFYTGGGFSQDLNTRLNTTGHTLEFVATALPEQRLKELWVRKAVAVLAKELIDHRRSPSEPGPLYHSLNALVTYRQRTRPVSVAAAELPAITQPATTLKPVIPGESTSLKPVPMPTETLPLVVPTESAEGPVSALAPLNR